MSVLGDGEIATRVTADFVPVAVDQHIHRWLRDEEGRFYQSLVRQAGASEDWVQGYYVATSGGRLLGHRHTLEAPVVKDLLRDALAAFRGAPRDEPSDGASPFDGLLAPPPGGLVLDVTARILGGYDPPSTAVERILQSSWGRDHAWVRRDEREALTRGAWPASLTRRLARFHLVDNTRGEPAMWEDDEIVSLETSFADGRVSGRVELESACGERSYRASLRGIVETRSGTVEDFDVIAYGHARGHGEYSPGAPRGEYPLAIRFTLARGSRPMDRVPPGGTRRSRVRRGVHEYLGLPGAR